MPPASGRSSAYKDFLTLWKDADPFVAAMVLVAILALTRCGSSSNTPGNSYSKPKR